MRKMSVLRDTIRRLGENDPTLTTLGFRNIHRSFKSKIKNGAFDAMIQALSVNTTVTTVTIVLRFFLDELTFDEQKVCVQAIGSLPNLKELRIVSVGFPCPALKIVAELLKSASKANILESLTLRSVQCKGQAHYNTNCSNANTQRDELRAFLVPLKQLTKLKRFIFEDAQIDFDLDALVLQGLATTTSLTEVGISNYRLPLQPQLSAESLSVLASLPNLEWLSLTRLHLDPLLPEFLADLTSHPRLRTLILNENDMREQSAIALSALIRQSTVIQGVHLSHNSIPDSGGAAIADALSQNTSIVDFDFTVNAVGPLCSRALARTLESPTCNLESLYLSQHNIPAEGIQLIATSLKRNSRLKSLALVSVQMTDESGMSIARALLENTTLERINLSANRLGNRTCVEFANLLRTRSMLKFLHLGFNRISSPGAVVLADALLVNSTLEQLNLGSDHTMGKIAFDAFEIMIQENMTLQNIWPPSFSCSRTIPSFLRLNRLGRKALMQDMNDAGKWFDVLSQCQGDLPALYFLIRANPNIVSWMV